MRSLDGWLCFVEGSPTEVVKVNWQNGRNCGCSYILPRELLGSHAVFTVDKLIPKERVRKVRPHSGMDMASAPTKVLEEKLEQLRKMRSTSAEEARAKRRRDTARSILATKGSMLGTIERLSPKGLDALETALEMGATKEAIRDIIKRYVKGEGK